MKRRKISAPAIAAAVVAAFGVGALSTPLLAQEQENNERRGLCWQPFTAIDQDGDGEISSEEIDARERLAFNRLDENNDEMVDWQEYVECVALNPGATAETPRDPYVEARTEEEFLGMDPNNDGKVTLSEYMDYSRKAYDDAFRYNETTPTLQLYAESMKGLSYDPMAADVDEDEKISQEEAATDVFKRFGSLDTDFDGRIEPSEWIQKERRAGAKERFQALDLNDNGRIERSEYRLTERVRAKDQDLPSAHWMYRSYQYY
ncbi:MAG: hypothetical protein RIC93_04715 [Alphaproteobacteria bacterium]